MRCRCSAGSSTHAWFVSNNTVKGTTTNISAQSNAAFMAIDKTVTSDKPGFEDFSKKKYTSVYLSDLLPLKVDDNASNGTLKKVLSKENATIRIWNGKEYDYYGPKVLMIRKIQSTIRWLLTEKPEQMIIYANNETFAERVSYYYKFRATLPEIPLTTFHSAPAASRKTSQNDHPKTET